MTLLMEKEKMNCDSEPRRGSFPKLGISSLGQTRENTMVKDGKRSKIRMGTKFFLAKDESQDPLSVEWKEEWAALKRDYILKPREIIADSSSDDYNSNASQTSKRGAFKLFSRVTSLIRGINRQPRWKKIN